MQLTRAESESRLHKQYLCGVISLHLSVLFFSTFFFVIMIIGSLNSTFFAILIVSGIIAIALIRLPQIPAAVHIIKFYIPPNILFVSLLYTSMRAQLEILRAREKRVT